MISLFILESNLAIHFEFYDQNSDNKSHYDNGVEHALALLHQTLLSFQLNPKSYHCINVTWHSQRTRC